MVAAQLQGADLGSADLQGAILADAQLQGANLALAELQGADLRFAKLQGADLRLAVLRGTDLRFAVLSGTDLRSRPGPGRTALVDLRGARGTPLNAEQRAEIREVLGKTIANRELREAALDRIERAGSGEVPPPILESCLVDPELTPELDCKQKWLPAEVGAFQRELLPVLEEVACESPAAAGGLMRQIVLTDEMRSLIGGVLIQEPAGVDSVVEMRGRIWLAGRFVTLLDKRECEGLSSLPEEDKDQIRALAKSSQLEADKPAGEVLPSPNPPPAIAPETP